MLGGGTNGSPGDCSDLPCAIDNSLADAASGGPLISNLDLISIFDLRDELITFGGSNQVIFGEAEIACLVAHILWHELHHEWGLGHSFAERSQDFWMPSYFAGAIDTLSVGHDGNLVILAYVRA